MSDKINEHSYNVYPVWYDIRGFFILTLSYKNSIFRQIKFFSENFKGRHLECAIGTASLTMLSMIHKKLFGESTPYHMVGVDYSEALLKGAKWKMRKSELLKEDLRSLSFPNDSFDSINFPNGYHTIDGVEQAMKEIHRVLKPSGTLYLNVLLHPKNSFLDRIARKINSYGMKTGILKRPYSLDEIFTSVKSYGFQVREEEVVGNCVYLKLQKQSMS